MAEENKDSKATKPKPTLKDVDAAFDSLAKFLFDQYRKYKEVQETQSK